MKPKTILLIDDDEDDQLIFKDAIREVYSGYSVPYCATTARMHTCNWRNRRRPRP